MFLVEWQSKWNVQKTVMWLELKITLMWAQLNLNTEYTSGLNTRAKYKRQKKYNNTACWAGERTNK